MISGKSVVAPYREESRGPDCGDGLHRCIDCEGNVSVSGLGRDEQPVAGQPVVGNTEDRCQTTIASHVALLGDICHGTGGQLRVKWTE